MTPATFAYVNTLILAVSFIAAIAMIVAARLLVRRRKYRRVTRLMTEYPSPPVVFPSAPAVPRLNLRSLTLEQSERHTARWHAIEERFIDDPRAAIQDADELVNQALITRGYPMREFEQHAMGLRTDHRDVVESYRIAHTLARKAARGPVSAESMRCAMQHYRELLECACESRLHEANLRQPTHTNFR